MGDYSFDIGRFSLMTTLLNVVNENSCESSSYVLACYFLKHFYELDKLNIYDVADECFVSRSGVQRFCKSIGFDTFSGLKSSSPLERNIHKTSFIAYANRPDFRDFTRASMDEMMREVEQMADRQDVAGFARAIHDSANVVLLTAEFSSMAPRDLQQELLVAGKLVSLVTDSHPDYALLRSLTEGDLLIVCSATGNYAYAVNDALAQLTKPNKALVTLNRDPLFAKTYQTVYYLSGQNLDHQRSVYTKYGVSYFLDLLYNTYLREYYPK